MIIPDTKYFTTTCFFCKRILTDSKSPKHTYINCHACKIDPKYMEINHWNPNFISKCIINDGHIAWLWLNDPDFNGWLSFDDSSYIEFMHYSPATYKYIKATSLIYIKNIFNITEKELVKKIKTIVLFK